MIYFRKLNMSIYEFHLGNIMRLLLYTFNFLPEGCTTPALIGRWRSRDVTGSRSGAGYHRTGSVEQIVVAGGCAYPRSPVS